jgi:secondary thiamine-phosphate synthase enzyme
MGSDGSSARDLRVGRAPAAVGHAAAPSTTTRVGDRRVVPLKRTKASSVHPSTNQYQASDGISSVVSGNGEHPAPEAPTGAGRTVEPDVVVELGHLVPVFVRRTVELTTERAFHVIDVTDECRDLLHMSGVQEGTLTVFSEHTTCAVKINERETCFLEDLRLFMEKLVPAGAYYRHDDFEIRDPETLAGSQEEEPINGHSHIKQMLLGASSESIPVVDGDLGLGRWQRIMFIELDQSRDRRIRLQVQGWR